MIRILFLSLLTLSLSCANTCPESAEEPVSCETHSVQAPAPTAADTARVRKTAKAPKAVSDRKAARNKRRTEHRAARPEREINWVPAPAQIHIAEVPTAPAVPVEINMPRPAEIYTPETIAEVVPADSLSVSPRDTLQLAAVDSIPGRKTRFLPMSRRMDREINRIRYVHKGEVMMGLTASYGTLESDDSDLWLVLDNINLGAHVFTVNPFVGYFFRDNICLGGRFGYSEISGSLGSAALDLDDINFAVNDIVLKNKSYSFGLFLRSYAGLDPKGHFGLFGELELSMSSGSSEFSYMSSGELHQTFGDNTKVKLSFNPGMAVYIFPNVCTTISFGLGGFQYVKTTQKDAEGNVTGKRTYSNMRFRLNLAEIRIGMTIHLWNKKKALLK